jgi:hypothetical protein
MGFVLIRSRRDKEMAGQQSGKERAERSDLS